MVQENRLVMKNPTTIRVCLLISSFPPAVGGGERHASLISQSLAQSGINMTVLTRHKDASSPRHEKQGNLEIIRVPPAGFPRLGKYFMIPKVMQILKNRKFDLVYVCGLRVLGLPAILAAGAKHTLLRAEACGEMDGRFIWQTPGQKSVKWKQLIFSPIVAARNRLLLKARGFLAISSPIQDEYIQAGVPREKITLIPNALDPDTTTAVNTGNLDERRKKLHIPPDAVIFTYTGKLNQGKGLDHLLQAWVMLSQKKLSKPIMLLLVGSGSGQHLSCEAQIRKIISDHHLERSVLLTGYVTNVADYLTASDAFVFPSLSEAQGLSVLEAMACGLPVFASRIPGIMDMIKHGHNGTLIPAGETSAWCNAMFDFCQAPEKHHHLAAAAKQTATQNYGLATITQSHIELFRKLTQP